MSRTTAIENDAVRREETARRVAMGLLFLVVLVALVLVAIAGMGDQLEMIQRAGPGQGKGIDGLEPIIRAVKGPANATVASVGGLGVAGGATMIALGLPKGVKVVGASAVALAAVAAGNGVIA